MKRKPLILSLVVIIVIAIITTVTYVFVFRQPDSNYEALNKSLSSLKEKQNSVSVNVSSLALPFFITESNLTSYSTNLTELVTAIKSVDSNPVVSSDNNLKDTYGNYKNDIQSYVSSNNDLVSSIKQYFAVSKACGDMSYSLNLIRTKLAPMTSSVFDTESKECQAAITTAESVPDKKFKDQFLSDYLLYMNTLVTAYRQEFSAAGNASILKSSQATIETTRNSIQLMNNGYLLDLTRSPNPADAISKLSAAATAQKNSFIR